VTAVCVIGAGCSGLAASAALRREGIDFTCFEQGSSVGGNWVFENDNGRSPTYESLRTNTSRLRSGFKDFPIPKPYGEYPHHTQMARYLADFAEHAGLSENIRFGTEVVEVAPEGSQWRVRLDDGETRHFSAVIVANGHHWDPRWPNGAEAFSGERLHAADYREPSRFAGKRVLVIGFGNAATEISCELTEHAAEVLLSFRRTLHVLPRFVAGVPFDRIEQKSTTRLLPWAAQRLTADVLLRMFALRHRDAGLPVPDHRLLEGHPTISDEIFHKVRAGAVRTKPAVARFEGRLAHFSDSSTEELDTVIFATGYKVSFPFLHEVSPPVSEERVALYRRMVHPPAPGLYFIGLLNAVGGLIPVVEAQAGWLSGVVVGRIELPAPEQMQMAIDDDVEGLERRFGTPNSILCDRYRYIIQLEQDARRARRGTRAQPAAPQADLTPVG
jgi:cation diffusion facilitator CzcD-associated flavoprotein CzcO